MDEVAAFHQELYEEHLEEASFLYELRTALLHDEELSWLDLEDYDRRIEAHLDGLLGGGFHGKAICIDAAMSGYAGDLYIAIRLLCRGAEVSELFKLLKNIDSDHEKIFQAIVDGLALGCPADWFPALTAFTEDECPDLLPVTIRVLAWRRAGTAPVFLEKHRKDIHLIDHLAWAQCRLPTSQGMYERRSQLLGGDPFANQTDCALGLLLLGDADLLRQLPMTESWARIPLGVAGSRAQAHGLLRATPVTTMGLLALGLLGDILAVEPLFQFLSDPGGAPSAARALDLITGADLREEVFIPEQAEEDELFDEELEGFRAGEPVKNPNGSPAGEFVIRLSQDEQAWRQWWQANRSRFQEDMRYRNGSLYAPSCLLENLRSEKSPNLIRMLAHLEFGTRYGFGVPFELEMPIPEQKQAIQAYATWVEEHSDQFTPGAWYFAGEIQ